MNKNILKISAVLATLLASPAIAADAIESPPEPPISAEPVYITPTSTWSGFYGGVAAGYTWGTFDSSAGDIDAKGLSGLGFAGVNLQSGALVYGAEGDLGYSGVKQTTAGGVTVDQGVFGSLRARLGYAFDPIMIYGTGGIAATQAKVTIGAADDTNTHLGWTVGAGAEALLTDNVFGRLEYRYSDYQTKDFTVGGTAVSSGFSDHTVRAGVGLKF
ncbi:MAG: outer membrane protein [Ahrensia sp.]|nr:outer membrane protein [Ahrensia sp.]